MEKLCSTFICRITEAHKDELRILVEKYDAQLAECQEKSQTEKELALAKVAEEYSAGEILNDFACLWKGDRFFNDFDRDIKECECIMCFPIDS